MGCRAKPQEIADCCGFAASDGPAKTPCRRASPLARCDPGQPKAFLTLVEVAVKWLTELLGDYVQPAVAGIVPLEVE